MFKAKTVCIRNLFYILQSAKLTSLIEYLNLAKNQHELQTYDLCISTTSTLHFWRLIYNSKDTSLPSNRKRERERAKKNRLVSNGISFHFTHTNKLLYILRSLHSEQRFEKTFDRNSNTLHPWTCIATIEGAIRQPAIGGGGSMVGRLDGFDKRMASRARFTKGERKGHRCGGGGRTGGI